MNTFIDNQEILEILSKSQKIKEEQDNASLSEDKDIEDENLVLSTIHSAKGLEYHSVFVLSLSEGFFPAAYALKSSDGIEEERRLFYVAVTRAEKNLFLLSNRAWDRSNDFFLDAAEPSRYLEELNSDLMDEWEIEESEDDLAFE